jgi:NADPH:quinone reductase-like Zn-dependent oxidoreductase
MRAGITIRTVFVFTMPLKAMADGYRDITDLLERQILTHPVARRFDLRACAEAHLHQETGNPIGKVLIDVRGSGS